jgi:hypothetical protein
MGAQGMAKVLNIEPCPPIKPGRGNVITGTFHHEAANTIDVHVEGLSKPIGTTDNHPFWSVTRQEFIEAGKLQQGEKLQLYKGQTAKVIQILPRPGPERVHNLEVMNEHVYRVSEQGVLVHNVCHTTPITRPLTTTEKNAYRSEARRIWEQSGRNNISRQGGEIHHRFPLEYSNLLPTVDPNRISNLILLDTTTHRKISRDRDNFRRTHSNPTPSDVMRFTIEIDNSYGSAMRFSN